MTSVFSIVCVYLISRLSTLENQFWCSCLEGNIASSLGSHYLSFVLFLEVRPQPIFLFLVNIFIDISLPGSCSGSYLTEVPLVWLPRRSQDTKSHNTLPVAAPSFAVFPPPLPCCSLSFMCRSCTVGSSVGAEHPLVRWSLHYNQLWFSVTNDFHLL